jgi:ATP-dependent DNA ligase
MATSFPEWVEPMAATLTQERFAGPDWTFERKLDGIRLLAFKHGREVRLLSRNKLPQNGAYPSVVEAVAALPARDIILDGEATGVWGKQGKVAYNIFDILWLDGRDVTTLPLEERRALLKKLPLRSPLTRVPPLDDEKPWERACAEGWEGVIAKRRGSPYEHRRSPHWLKMKCEATQELVIGGFTDPQGGRKCLGALLVGYFERDSDGKAANKSEGKAAGKGKGGGSTGTGDGFAFAGKVGTGFDTKLLLELRARLDKLEVDTPPFTITKGLPKLRSHWVKPQIVVQVAFTEWTVHGKLRHPRLLGLRIDKAARDVVREQP